MEGQRSSVDPNAFFEPPEREGLCTERMAAGFQDDLSRGGIEYPEGHDHVPLSKILSMNVQIET